MGTIKSHILGKNLVPIIDTTREIIMSNALRSMVFFLVSIIIPMSFLNAVGICSYNSLMFLRTKCVVILAFAKLTKLFGKITIFFEFFYVITSRSNRKKSLNIIRPIKRMCQNKSFYTLSQMSNKIMMARLESIKMLPLIINYDRIAGGHTQVRPYISLFCSGSFLFSSW